MVKALRVFPALALGLSASLPFSAARGAGVTESLELDAGNVQELYAELARGDWRAVVRFDPPVVTGDHVPVARMAAAQRQAFDALLEQARRGLSQARVGLGSAACGGAPAVMEFCVQALNGSLPVEEAVWARVVAGKKPTADAKRYVWDVYTGPKNMGALSAWIGATLAAKPSRKRARRRAAESAEERQSQGSAGSGPASGDAYAGRHGIYIYPDRFFGLLQACAAEKRRAAKPPPKEAKEAKEDQKPAKHNAAPRLEYFTVVPHFLAQTRALPAQWLQPDPEKAFFSSFFKSHFWFPSSSCSLLLKNMFPSVKLPVSLRFNFEGLKC